MKTGPAQGLKLTSDGAPDMRLEKFFVRVFGPGELYGIGGCGAPDAGRRQR